MALNREVGNTEAGSGLLDGLGREIPLQKVFEGVKRAKKLGRKGSLHFLPCGLRVRGGQPALLLRSEQMADDEPSRLEAHAGPVPFSKQEVQVVRTIAPNGESHRKADHARTFAGDRVNRNLEQLLNLAVGDRVSAEPPGAPRFPGEEVPPFPGF